jgi:hypothetical protein
MLSAVTPAWAGVHQNSGLGWIPAFAGMTSERSRGLGEYDGNT